MITTIIVLDITHRLVFYLKTQLSGTGFGLCLEESAQMGHLRIETESSQRWTVSKIVIVILLYHHHKPMELIMITFAYELNSYS
jgi:hypothetical protein